MYGYIYVTTNLVNGKKYIGQKQSDRFLEDEYLGSGVILSRAIRKYGRNSFSVKLIEECESREELDEKEIYWIKFYDAVNSDNFYNLQVGGQGSLKGSKHSIECRIKISSALKGRSFESLGRVVSIETRNKIRESMLGSKNHWYGKPGVFTGCKHTEETKTKISLALANNKNGLNHHPSEEARDKMKQARLGKHLSDEAKKKISESKTGRKLSDEAKRNFSKARIRDNVKPPNHAGMIVVNNGIVNKKIHPSELENYISNGFVRGFRKKVI